MDHRSELVRVDTEGVARPVGVASGQRLRAQSGDFRLLPGPRHVVFMRFVGEDGARDADDGAIVRLAGEVTKPGTLCDIVALVAQAGWRGELLVLDSESSRSVFFEAGNAVAASSTVSGERAGEVMYKLGALTREQVDRVSAQVGKDRRFGEVAVEMGLLSRERVFELMAKQVEEIAYACLLVGDGMFWFLDDFDDARLPSRHAIAASGLLMEGVRRMDEVKYFRQRIPSEAHVPMRIAGRADPPAPLRRVLEACDGRRSVLDVGRACGLDEFDVTHAVFQLVQAGFVQIQPPLPTSVEAIVAIFNDAMRAIYVATEAVGQIDALRSTLAMYASTAGVYDVLFLGAGPADDGTLKEARVARNIVHIADDDPAGQLAEWLYDYAAYALFNATAVLPKADEQALTKRVHDALSQLAPRSTRSGE